jgi:uncharacterized Zn-finger protein
MMNQVVDKNKTVTVKADDLPLSCPTKDMSTWNTHPRVYIDLGKTSAAACQYCGTQFVLEK